MTKIHFRHNPNQTVLFPPRIDEDIAEHDPVRMVDALGSCIRNAGAALNPRMMLKVIL